MSEDLNVDVQIEKFQRKHDISKRMSQEVLDAEIAKL